MMRGPAVLVRLQQLRAEFGKPGPESGFCGHRVSAGAGAADTVTVAHVGRARIGITPARAADMMAAVGAAPFGIQRRRAKFGQPLEECGFGDDRVLAGACTADSATALDVMRCRVAVVTGRTPDMNLGVGIPVFAQDHCASLSNPRTECCRRGNWIPAGAGDADPATLLDVVRPRVTLMTDGAADMMGGLAVDVGLEQFST